MEQDNRITVGIADDETLIRAGVRDVLQRTEDVVVVGEARDGAAAVELARRCRPRVLLLDADVLGLDVLAVIRLVRRDVPVTEIIMLGTSATSDLTVPALRAGAAGFLRKSSLPDDFVCAVRSVAAGRVTLCPAATRDLIDQLLATGTEPPQRACDRVGTLTEREREVLIHVAHGMSNAAIARALWLSQSSVKAHVSRILIKLRCDSRLLAALMAYDAGLINRP
ncbi:response regulator transcription factor [Lentzea sp. PSKA42]|uniref:Response regulator transcription factor n=1 Tax=Lentzea indica TaxID=2604800 RepID=A0ABX1FFU8_9PSEU|nr:response regulator transcription factor [Lentzea indica]NKE57854.1 response regulator transcription factor [Lentzea indica]